MPEKTNNRFSIVQMRLSSNESKRFHGSNADMVQAEMLATKDPNRIDRIVATYGNSLSVLQTASIHPFTATSTLEGIMQKTGRLLLSFKEGTPERFALETTRKNASTRITSRAVDYKNVLREDDSDTK